MSNSDHFGRTLPASRPPGPGLRQAPVGDTTYPTEPLINLSAVSSRMDTLQHFLSSSINSNTLIGKDQMDMVSSEISTAIHEIIVNGAALLACTQFQKLSSPSEQTTSNPNQTAQKDYPISASDLKFEIEDVFTKNSITNSTFVDDSKKVIAPKIEKIDGDISDDYEIIELDAVELLAEHMHFCDICGKGFKRDANLRMHMRAHGNQFKTPEALAKPQGCAETRRKTRFSCPFVGCNRNKSHKKFRPLKSAICVKNHFKRSHCPKMYSCNRCNKKRFSVLADLKNHLKHCGETKWMCSCGTSFSRKDKLFGHMALFEGHMPAVEDDEKAKGMAEIMEDEEEEEKGVEDIDLGTNCSENSFFDGLLDEFGSIENFCPLDELGSPSNGSTVGIDGFLNF